MSRRALGVALAVIAAATSVLATFLPYSWIGTNLGATRFGFTTTGWDKYTEAGPLPDLGPQAQTGVPVVIAAVLLAVGAALVFLPPHQRRAGQYTAVAATGLLIGSVWTTFAVVTAGFTPTFRDAEMTLAHEYGVGLWLLVAACAVAIAATVFLHGEPAAPRPAPEGVIVHRPQDETDDDTPPFGISVPVLPEGYLGPDHPAPGAAAGPADRTDAPERTT